MRLKIDVPIMDLVNGTQAKLNNRDATLRSAIVYIGCMPSPKQSRGEEEDLGTIAAAWSIASRAANLEKDGWLELDLSEASLLKTRGFQILLPMIGGQLADALEKAAEA